MTETPFFTVLENLPGLPTVFGIYVNNVMAAQNIPCLSDLRRRLPITFHGAEYILDCK